jgi:hypothetical protein
MTALIDVRPNKLQMKVGPLLSSCNATRLKCHRACLKKGPTLVAPRTCECTRKVLQESPLEGPSGAGAPKPFSNSQSPCSSTLLMEEGKGL